MDTTGYFSHALRSKYLYSHNEHWAQGEPTSGLLKCIEVTIWMTPSEGENWDFPIISAMNETPTGL